MDLDTFLKWASTGEGQVVLSYACLAVFAVVLAVIFGRWLRKP